MFLSKIYVKYILIVASDLIYPFSMFKRQVLFACSGAGHSVSKEDSQGSNSEPTLPM